MSEQILTEEELKEIEIIYGVDNEKGWSDAPKLTSVFASHRSLNSRNLKLVLENDELMAENEKLKNAMVEVYCRTVGLNYSVSSYAKYALEENGYDTSELPIE